MFTRCGSTRVVAGSAAIGLLFATAACSAAPGSLDRAGGQQVVAPTTLVMAAPAGEAEIGAYVANVARQSGGSLQIQVLSRDQTRSRVGLPTANIIDAVRTGDVPLALLPAKEFGALGVASLDALLAPFVVDSLSLEGQLLSDQEIIAPMLDGISALGVEGVGILPGPLVHPFGITHPLLAPKDFEGATIAVGAGEMAARTLALLGAGPVESNFNGARVDDFDGALLQLPAVTGNGYHAAGRSVTADVTLWPRPLVVIGNTDALAALTDEQRAVLHDAAEASVNGVVARQVAMDAEAADIGCSVGLTLPLAGRADLEELRAAVRPLVDEIAATDVGATVFARVDELRSIVPGSGRSPASPSRHRGRPRSPTGSTAPTRPTPPRMTCVLSVCRSGTSSTRTGDTGHSSSRTAASPTRRRTHTPAPGATAPGA